MALDVHLTRDVNERWGFDLIGGADDEMPLTIQKLQPSSPASRAGLQNGDTILTINGEEAIDFTHEEACRRVAECEDTLSIGVMRGLYDPVLDDQEPIYYEPGDSDPESQPTEVPFKIQHFVEPADLGSNLLDYGTNNEPCETPFDPSVLLSDSRSLTASPFVPSTKPYRPFSTEPLPEIPALEDPIILNPDYKDQFGVSPADIIPDYILNAHNKNGGFEGKFKLPISEQYDPDGTRKIKNCEIDSVLSKYINMETLSKKTVATDQRTSKTCIKDLKVTEKSTKDVNISDSISKDSKMTLVTDIQTKEAVAKDVKQESLKVTSEDIRLKEEKEVKTSEKKETVTESVEEKMIKEELKYIEQMKQDIDIAQIEKTAISVVEDSIERAVSVTEEIKKEMEEELTSVTASETEKVSTVKSEIDNKIVESETSVSKSKTAKETNLETVDTKTLSEEHIKDIQKTVARTNQEERISESVAKTDIKSAITSKSMVSEQEEIIKMEAPQLKESLIHEAEILSESRREDKSESKKVTRTVTSGTSSEKTGAQQRSYVLGLQTIPNIRGVAYSSYHYDLLLRTFFIHLTDVMVALSRFILTQPVFNSETMETKTVSETQMSEQESSKKEKHRHEEQKTSVEVKQENKVEERTDVVKPVAAQEKKQEIKAVSQKTEKDVKVQEKKMKKRELVTPVSMEKSKIETYEKAQSENTTTIEKHGINEAENRQESIFKTEEKKSVSGSQMAQRTEKKLTKEMTQKIDAVISEFQTIAVEEDKNEMLLRSRRSRSRSQIEEEVAKESDPLEWLSKVDSRRASQEISEERLSKKEYSSSETMEKKHTEILEKQEIKHKKAKTPKQMYLAVVESHVYTNKDVIFEDAAEFSETSSVQSAEETNTAFEAIETMSTENVALECAVQQIEKAKIVEESHALAKVSAQSAAVVQKTEEILHETKHLAQEEYRKETAKQSTDIQEVIIQESKEIIEPVIDLKETIKKESVSVNINESLSIAETSEISIQESKSEFKSVESKKESVAIVEENYRDSAVIESKKVEEAIEVVDTKTQSKVQIEDITEKVVVKSEKADIKTEVQDESAALKIIKEVETAIESKNEIIEIEEVLDVSKETDQETVISKIEMSKELELDESKMVTEKSFVSSEFGLAKSEVSGLKISSEIDISNHVENYKSESHISEEIIQESSFTARSVENNKKLTLRTDLEAQDSLQSAPSTIDTPTPSTVPPTPLTDEYVFKLTIPLPKSRGTTPVPRDCTLSPEDEDPHIVKKKLIPHIETTLEKAIVYDPPLPTPPSDKVQSPIFKTPGLFGGSSKPVYKIRFPPVYRKPGLFGGADNPEYSKEEIREIERKSSLLASAIDETIKSIQEYKEEVGIQKKKEVKFTEFKEEKVSKSYQESYSEEVVLQNGVEENNVTIQEVEINNNDIIANNNISDSKVNIEEVKEETSSNIEMLKEEVTNTEKEVQKESSVVESQSKLEEVELKKTELDKTTTEIETNNITVAEERECQNKEIETKIASEPAVEISEVKLKEEESEKRDPMLGYRPVVFDPEAIQKRGPQYGVLQASTQDPRGTPYLNESGEIIGTAQGIVDGVEDSVMTTELAKELGRPGISEEKIAELISGEAEMLREAHVMGLSRVLTSHMHRADDSSVDFQKIKPMIDSLKDSEVLKALNEEMAKKREEEKKKEEKKWTTFLQKPKRPVPKAKFGYHGWTEAEQALVLEPYKVKIVKQSKPKVAPDYKPEDFETGPLPWEQRAELEGDVPPVEPEEPILVPELPEYLEAVDPLKESEVPDLEDTGIPLPPPKEPTPPLEVIQPEEEVPIVEEEPEIQEVEEVEEEKETREEMENRIADQLVRSVQGMVDPNATVDQQLAQMRAQLAALAQLPEVIQQTLELVSKQLNKITTQEARTDMSAQQTESQTCQEIEVIHNHISEETQDTQVTENTGAVQIQELNQETYANNVIIEEMEDKMETAGQQVMQQEMRRVETPQITEEDMRMEKMKKEQLQATQLDSESRQIKQRPTPRVGKPKRVFGPPDSDVRPVVLPGGRRWRKTADVYNEQMIQETLRAQAELIQGKAMGFESDLLPYDTRINFMKYEKPPVSLDHLQNSETYKLVHDMDQPPLKRVEMRTPVIAEADYRERCRSMTPAGDKHKAIPHQFHP